MQYLTTARDGAGMPEKRMEMRPRHLENMAKVREKGHGRAHERGHRK